MTTRVVRRESPSPDRRSSSPAPPPRPTQTVETGSSNSRFKEHASTFGERVAEGAARSAVSAVFSRIPVVGPVVGPAAAAAVNEMAKDVIKSAKGKEKEEEEERKDEEEEGKEVVCSGMPVEQSMYASAIDSVEKLSVAEEEEEKSVSLQVWLLLLHDVVYSARSRNEPFSTHRRD